MPSEPILSPERLAALRFKQAKLHTTDDGLIDLLAADLGVGDRLSWGGELLEITAVTHHDDELLEVFGTHKGWSFPLEFRPFEEVRVAAPRPTPSPGPTPQGG